MSSSQYKQTSCPQYPKALADREISLTFNLTGLHPVVSDWCPSNENIWKSIRAGPDTTLTVEWDMKLWIWPLASLLETPHYNTNVNI